MLIWTVGLILGLSITDATFTNSKHLLPQPKPVLIVLVRDLVGTDPATRNIARTEAIRILDKAGIELRWIHANGTEDPRFPSTTVSYVTVVISPQPPAG